jgi:excisionase family DNA binding protein
MARKKMTLVGRYRLLKISEVCQMLSMGRTCVYELVRTGKIPASQFDSGQWRIRQADVEAYIDKCFAKSARGRDDEQTIKAVA